MGRPKSEADGDVFDALLGAARRHGASKPILEDQERRPLSYTDLVRASFALGRKIAGLTEVGERVGVLLPSSSAAVVTFFGAHAFGRIPTMLNFTLSSLIASSHRSVAEPSCSTRVGWGETAATNFF